MNRATARCLRSALVALTALAASPAAADSIRCEGGIVSTGDRAIDLTGKCGPATLVDRRQVKEVRVSTAGAAVEPALAGGRVAALGAATTDVETWTYDLGPNQLIRLVTVAQGRVTRIETAGYGHAAPPRERPALRLARCDPASIGVGDTKLDLLATCGEPAVRDAWEEVRGEGAAAGGEAAAVLVTSTVEVWTYDFGPDRFVRFARIEAGKVTAVESGSYGYAR